MNELERLPLILNPSEAPPDGWVEHRVSLHGRGTIRIATPRGDWDHLAPSSLPHLAFLRELWERKGRPDWTLPGYTGEVIPDAVWHSPKGVWAIEIDLGYPLSKVKRKVEAYAKDYAGQLWGVLSPSRLRQVALECWPRPFDVELMGIPNRRSR